MSEPIFSADFMRIINDEITALKDRIEQLASERDEARAAAREILLDSVGQDDHAYRTLANRRWSIFPWLLEK